MERPTLRDILKAKHIADRYLARTPLHHSPALSEMTGASVYVKYENHSPIGSFKLRGAFNQILAVPEEVRARGIVACSTGNHAQAIGLAARTLGIPATVFMPETANPDKIAATRRFGVRVVLTGSDYDEARPKALELAEKEGLWFSDDAEDVNLLAGHATIGLEIVQDLPDVDAVIVPTGGGALLAGVACAVKALSPQTRVIGVAPEQARCMHLSWEAKRLITTDTCDTFADGLASRVPYDYLLNIALDMVDRIVVVSEAEIEQAVLAMLEATHIICEGAGAVPLAATLRYPEEFHDQKIALVASGGNLPLDKLRYLLAKYRSKPLSEERVAASAH